MRKKARNKVQNITFWVVGILILIGVGVFAVNELRSYWRNIDCIDCKYVCIPTGADYDDVVHLLKKDRIIKDVKSFKLLSEQLGYMDEVKAGRYAISASMSNKDIVELLKSGKQTKVSILIEPTISKSKLLKNLSDDIELSKSKLSSKLSQGNIFDRVLPITYDVNWNLSSDELMDAIDQANKEYWEKGERKSKIKANGLSVSEAMILASIVDKESNKKSDMVIIAGLYINRLKQGWKLQADPTVKYAVGNWSLRRIRKKHTKIKSAYNTYYTKGLPPAPICVPRLMALEAVINATKHNYMFMCADAERPGYHAFAVTLEEHNANAKKYHDYLNNRGVR